MPSERSNSQKHQRDTNSPVKAPIILAKHDKTGDGRSASGTSRLWRPEAEEKQPTSPRHGIPAALQSGDLPAYKIQQRSDPKSGTDWTKVPVLPDAVKVVDEFMNWSSDSLVEYLMEQNDYRVIGVIGRDGVGKTHILSLLASHPNALKTPFQSTERPFKPDGAGHSTIGLNVFVTNERLILIDCQPLFSTFILDDIIRNERKYNTDLGNCEDLYESINLQLIMFLLAVSHMVLVVENYFTDPNLHRALQIVEMLKPPQLTTEKADDRNEFTSKLVFIQNMVEIQEPDQHSIQQMEAALTKMYSKSTLKVHKNQSDRVKLLLLPTKTDRDEMVYNKYEESFVQEIMNIRVVPPANHTSLSEKNWLQYASKMWEAVKKCPFISEYMRLLVSL